MLKRDRNNFSKLDFKQKIKAFLLARLYFFKRPPRGFTLIELLVVISIIGILSSITLVSLNSARQRARDTRRLADLRQVQLALEIYFDRHGTYPFQRSNCGSPLINHKFCVLVDDNILGNLPRDPFNVGRTFRYAHGPASATTSATHYHIGATLEDVNSAFFNFDQDCDSKDTGQNCPNGQIMTDGFDGTDAMESPCDDGDIWAGACYDIVQ
jgi:prepilin-type N-terminal cleavage/methylation domain-containing protein